MLTQKGVNMNAKELAVKFFNEYLELAKTDQRQFRRTVMDKVMELTSCSNASAATHYNFAKKLAEANGLVNGLGRQVKPQVRKTETVNGVQVICGKDTEDDNSDVDTNVYTIQQIEDGKVG
jgi:hypothetical protein